MSARELFVVLIRILGLYVLSGNALYYWLAVLSERIVNTERPDRDTFTFQLVYALAHTVVGLYFLICAEHVARFSEVTRRPAAADESDQSPQPTDEPRA